MRVFGLTRIVPAAVVAAAVVAMCAGDASARSRGSWGSSGSSGSSSSGSYGSYGSSGSSSGSYGSASSGSSGSHGGLFARWHARKAARASSSSGSYGSSSGSSGSYGSYGSSSSGSSGSSSGSYGSYGGAYYESAPIEMEGSPEMAPEAAPAEAPMPPQASINVTVPADAVVFVNDRPTTSTGANRHYISRGLMMGRTYAYQIRVEFQKDGEKVVENKTVRLQPGQSEELSFGSGEQMVKDSEPAKTQVTVHVPAGAKVTLAGAETRQTGELRTFVTTTLANGEKWDGYTVRVTMKQDGKMLTEEKSLSIEGGQNYELSFDFADNTAQVASVN